MAIVTKGTTITTLITHLLLVTHQVKAEEMTQKINKHKKLIDRVLNAPVLDKKTFDKFVSKMGWRVVNNGGPHISIYVPGTNRPFQLGKSAMTKELNKVSTKSFKGMILKSLGSKDNYK